MRRNRVSSNVTNVKYVADEAAYARQHLRRWMHPLNVSTPLIIAPGHTKVRLDPLGVGLIIGTWNYPVILILGAASGGYRGRERRGDQAVGARARHSRRARQARAPVSRSRGVLRRGRRGAGDRRCSSSGGTTSSSPAGRRSADRHAAAAETSHAGGARAGRQEPDDRALLGRSAGRRPPHRPGPLVNAGQTCTAPDHILVFSEVQGIPASPQEPP